MGRVALALLLVQVLAGLSRRAVRLPYERWRRVHNVFAPTILALGFVHSLAAGDDLHGGGLVIWAGLAVHARPSRVAIGAARLRAIEAGGVPRLKVIHVLSSAPASWVGETGRLDADRLARLCTGVEDPAFYLCCPPPMMVSLIRGLRRMGGSPRRIHADQFSL